MRVQSLCTSCAQTISNPLCPRCFAHHVELWLRDKNLTNKQAAEVKRKLNKMIIESEETTSEIPCLICDREQVNLCTYCFTHNAELILSKISEEVLEEFEDDFHGELWKMA